MKSIIVKFNSDREIIHWSEDAEQMPIRILEQLSEHFNYRDFDVSYDEISKHYRNADGEEWIEEEYRNTTPDFDNLPNNLLTKITQK